MMNSDSSSEKMSQIEKKVNYILGLILIIQAVLCLIVAILDGVFYSKNYNTHYYINFTNYGSGGDAALIFCTYFVLINTMIPISLIVSIEIVKMSQSYFIDKDRLMYSDFRKRGPTVKSASLNEELGQI
jgi:magnesium-transporting ATPase (P-type)